MKMEGYEAIEKTATKGGNSARVYVPKQWEGKKMKLPTAASCGVSR